jgi:nucleoside phosphorylase
MIHIEAILQSKLRRTYDTAPAPLLVVAPTERELGGIRNRRMSGVGVAVVGLGREAGGALQAVLQARPPEIILSLGFAGALTDGARTGDLVLSRRLTEVDSSPWTEVLQGSYLAIAKEALSESSETVLAIAKEALSESSETVIEGDLLTVPSPLLSSEKKRFYGESTGAVVVDMEGYWLAREAQIAGLPMIPVRAVIDEMDDDLPGLVGDIVADGGRREWLHALRAMRNPVTASALLPLAMRSRKAQQALRRAVGSLLPALTDNRRLRAAYR